jgi:hypothetical protein
MLNGTSIGPGPTTSDCPAAEIAGVSPDHVRNVASAAASAPSSSE